MLYYADINKKECILVYYKKNNEKPNISIPNKHKGKRIIYIKAGTFAEEKKVGAVLFNKYIKEIGRYAFKNCTKLLWVKTSTALTIIKNEAFAGCYSLKYIDLYNKIKFIGEKAFYECISLKCIKLPNGLKEIKRETFGECESLSEIHIPKSVKKIHATAFNGCNTLVIYAPKNSYAIKFAKKNNIKFVEEN